jgi:hypothetical protein
MTVWLHEPTAPPSHGEPSGFVAYVDQLAEPTSGYEARVILSVAHRRRIVGSRVALNGAQIALIAVCILHALSPIAFLGLHSALGYDEAVYISQINPHVPAAFFTAPRARGMTLLTAPASYLSPSLAVMRVWLSLLSGAGLFMAFVPWLRLRRGAVMPVAALLWSSLWISIYYGYEAMPNQYVAFGATAATGWLILVMRRPSRRHLGYVGLSLAFVALMRPTDCCFLVAALVVGVVFTRTASARHRATVLAVMALGMGAGMADWIVEAYARFGGPRARLRMASAENTGGLHWSLGKDMRNLAGPILCRQRCNVTAPVDARLWWFALVPLVAIGLVAAYRQGFARMHLLATASALAIASEYAITIGYSSPRFLEPSYLLLALPVAEGVVWLARTTAPAWRPLAIGAAAIVFAAQLNNQVHIVGIVNQPNMVKADRDHAIASSLTDAEFGDGGHCNITGANAALIAFMTRCTDDPDAGRSANPADRHRQVAQAVVSEHRSSAGSYYADWPEYSVKDPRVPRHWRVWLLPGRPAPRPVHRPHLQSTMHTRMRVVSPGLPGGAGGRPR